MSNGEAESPFTEPVEMLKASDPRGVADASGSTWVERAAGEGEIVVPVLNGSISVSFPGVEIQAPAELSSFTLKLLTVIYLSRAVGAAPSGRWVSFRELSGGRFYEPVLERSVETPLADAFGADLEAFRRASSELGGREEEPGDASYSFRLFPLVPVLLILWRGDEEFPARAQVLFDSNSTSHLSAFDLRMGAQEIVGRLIRLSARGDGG